MAQSSRPRPLDRGAIQIGRNGMVTRNVSIREARPADVEIIAHFNSRIAFETEGMRLQSVYVHGDYRRSGVFSALYGHVESLAREDPGVCGIRLYVERENVRAQRTYESLGMTNTDYLVMQSMFTGDD